MRIFKALSLRLLFGLLSLVFISFVTFVADALAPGDAARIAVGEKASEEQYLRVRHNMGLDQPWPVRYAKYINNTVHGDFGNSYQGTKQPVSEILAESLPLTMKIAALAIVLAASFGITLGTIAAIWRTRVPDRSILTLSTLGVTVPNFVLAPLLQIMVGRQYLDILPQTWESNMVAPEIMYLILPVIILAARPGALITRLTRASMIDTLQQEFIRTAVAKGVPRTRLYLRHALRNAILPVITAIGTSFGFLLTGSFVVEVAFRIPGIGMQTIEAIRQNNTPVTQACVLVTGAMFIFLNLIVDLLLPILDPRIRESQV